MKTDGWSTDHARSANPGASFPQAEGDKIHSEHTYLDRQTMTEATWIQSQISLNRTPSQKCNSTSR
jgi:hypothetical protein